jgi:protein-disulfide isomerase
VEKPSSPFLFCLLTLTTQCANTVADPKPAPTNEAPAAAGAPAPAKVGPKGTAQLDDLGAPAVRVPIDGLPAFGSARALVTIVAFTDYECSYCGRAEETLASLRVEYGERVRMVVASRPLPMHDNAAPAARAFLAAAEQGKGEAMHGRLFAKGAALDDEGLRAAAHDLGLDVASFDRARKDKTTEAALRRTEALANTLAVEGTPTFFVNGRRLMGARPAEVFRALIDEELAKARALVEKGVALENVYATILSTSPEASALKGAALVNGPEAIADVGVENAPLRGPSRAPVTIVLFSDFECPFCVKAETTLRSLEAANPGKVRVAFRHRPLPMHPHARLAAKASVAAERQGRFWEYHDVLLAHRDALEREALERYADELGLNHVRFVKDLDDPEIDARVTSDERQAETLGVKGTPTAFVNGRRIVGAQPLSAWLGAVERSLPALH